MTESTKEIKVQPEVKKPQAGDGTKNSCGCGCNTPVKTK
ncbi:MAG: hypothetical protein BMS9Abin23_0764 [Thermodesulfobacteriota bacterium]|nr:MAG: hypothetical protein BMS9Abin23_0764 [Thermodesulfobacteriota bacterium]